MRTRNGIRRADTPAAWNDGPAPGFDIECADEVPCIEQSLCKDAAGIPALQAHLRDSESRWIH